jgi:hypothetical protein
MGDQWSDLTGAPEGDRTFKVPDPMYYVGWIMRVYMPRTPSSNNRHMQYVIWCHHHHIFDRLCTCADVYEYLLLFTTWNKSWASVC